MGKRRWIGLCLIGSLWSLVAPPVAALAAHLFVPELIATPDADGDGSDDILILEAEGLRVRRGGDGAALWSIDLFRGATTSWYPLSSEICEPKGVGARNPYDLTPLGDFPNQPAFVLSVRPGEAEPGVLVLDATTKAGVPPESGFEGATFDQRIRMIDLSTGAPRWTMTISASDYFDPGIDCIAGCTWTEVTRDVVVGLMAMRDANGDGYGEVLLTTLTMFTDSATAAAKEITGRVLSGRTGAEIGRFAEEAIGGPDSIGGGGRFQDTVVCALPAAATSGDERTEIVSLGYGGSSGLDLAGATSAAVLRGRSVAGESTWSSLTVGRPQRVVVEPVGATTRPVVLLDIQVRPYPNAKENLVAYDAADGTRRWTHVRDGHGGDSGRNWWAPGDLDGDGGTDIVLRNYIDWNQGWSLEAVSGGTGVSHWKRPDPGRFSSIYPDDDLSGDGLPDIKVVSGSWSRTSWMLDGGDGHVRWQVPVGVGSIGGDVGGSVARDLVVTSLRESGASRFLRYTLMEGSDASDLWIAEMPYVADTWNSRLVAADLDGAGKDEFLVFRGDRLLAFSPGGLIWSVL